MANIVFIIDIYIYIFDDVVITFSPISTCVVVCLFVCLFVFFFFFLSLFIHLFLIYCMQSFISVSH